VLGNQVGGGRGRDIATVVGAVGGAVAGHQVEKHVKRSVGYEIAVTMDDGSERTFTQSERPAWRPGDKVRVEGDRLVARG
jgi:outer membrane lipoprotein SlyB